VKECRCGREWGAKGGLEVRWGEVGEEKGLFGKKVGIGERGGWIEGIVEGGGRGEGRE